MANQPYRFGRTDRFTSDQSRFLEKVLYDFAERTVQNLAPLLLTRFEMELVSTKTRKYGSQLSALPDPTPILVFSLKEQTCGFLNLDFGLALALFEKLLGCPSSPPNLCRANFTELEKTILKIPFAKILAAYGDAWSDVATFRPKLCEVEFNPDAVHIYTLSEPMMVTSLRVAVDQYDGLLEVCIPVRHLRALLPKHSFEEFLLSKSRELTRNDNPVLPDNLYSVQVPVSARLGQAELLFQELLGIEVGDTIRLDAEINAPLAITVNDRAKFLGRPGILGRRIATKILKVLKDDLS